MRGDNIPDLERVIIFGKALDFGSFSNTRHANNNKFNF